MAAGNFRRGGENAQEAAESQGGGKFAKVNYLNLKDGESVILRYLQDSPEWLFVDQHISAPTKNAPADYPKDKKWPTTMGATCRHDDAFKGIHSDCYICDAGLTNQWGRPCKPSVRVYIIACLREEVLATEEHVGETINGIEITADKVGTRIGYRDQTRTDAVTNEKGEDTGQTKTELALIVVNQAPSNYSNALQAMYPVYKTVCDRDYVVKRKGEQTDTEFSHVPLDPTPALKPGTEKWERYEKAIVEQNLNVEEIAADKASDEFFARFFDPTKTDPKAAQSGGQSGTAPQVPNQASDAPSEDRMAEMRERVKSAAGLGQDID